jgi:AraC-like DNA-binding protein
VPTIRNNSNGETFHDLAEPRMSESLFAYDHRNFRECQQSYRGDANQEYYLGHYSIEPGPVIDVRAERTAAGCCSIIRLRSRNRLSFRRAWCHIQADATDVAVLWFVKRGALRIFHQNGQSLVEAGDFAITHSMTPFFMECRTDAELVHEVLHAVIPTYVFRRFISAPTGFCTTTSAPEFSIAERMFTDVFEDRGRMSERSSQLLIDGALSLLHDAIADRDFRQYAKRSLKDRRSDDVMRFIEIHFCDPALSLAQIAKAVGISTRYLSQLLEHRGISFSELVWDKRLQAARERLASPGPSSELVREIAYRVGFKSPAHFSRKFRRAFDMSPQEYRSAAGVAQQIA